MRQYMLIRIRGVLIPASTHAIRCLRASSFEIKNAIQKIFKVKVSKINTSIVRGKLKNFKGKYGFKKNYKKAIVTLAEGQTIDTSLDIK